MTSDGICRKCRRHYDDAYFQCECEEPDLSENHENIVQPDFNAGDSEPINDPDTTTPEDITNAEESLPETIEPEDNTAEVGFGVHVLMLTNGEFAIQATGDPNLGEMFMILSRAVESVKARMVGETVVQLQAEERKQTRIITPQSGGLQQPRG